MNTITEIILKAESAEGILTPSETLALVEHVRALDIQLTTARIEVNKVLATTAVVPDSAIYKYFKALANLLS